MKILIAALFALSSCAHTRIKSWRENEVTVCGNQWAKPKDFEAEAAGRCQGKLKLIGGGESDTGSFVAGDSFGRPTVDAVKEPCAVYRCEK